MIQILQWGLERSVCHLFSFYETTNPIFNQYEVLLIDNETIVELEELGFTVLTEDGFN